MQKNFEKLKAVIVGEWRTGAYSIRDLARKHEVSVGFVAKQTAGVEKDGLEVVNAGVAYKQGLAERDEHFVNAVHDVVAERTKHIIFFNNATVRNLSEMVGKIGRETTIAEHRIAQAAIKDGRETILGKTPDTALQVNVGEKMSVADAIRAAGRERLSPELQEMIAL
jgi:hypothetical protein